MTQPNQIVSLTAQDLLIFSYMISVIMSEEVRPEHTRDNPKKIGLSVGDTFRVTVEFYHRGETMASADAVWDQVRINGKDCGNRAGGRNEFTRLVTEHYTQAATVAA